jgi:mono/diheme cytochrome c family protein
MKFSALLVFFFLVGCQDLNSNSYDKDKYGPSDLVGGAEFRVAFPILRDRCASCHQHQDWSTYTDEEKWVEVGKVDPGNPDNSDVVTRIINYGNADSDMPPDSGALSDEEFEAIKVWVESLQ